MKKVELLMRLSNKGSSFYELMVCLIIIITMINYCVIYLSQLRRNINENREEYHMKQLLFANLMLLEANETLLPNDENYQFLIDEEKICIEWIGINENKKSYCETYFK
ncbi:MAG: hypothetical protein K0Q49_1778 [Haloplasmataceae bacterium]|jgi:hypothetical protein|nr:hypothetical protein [Haloplasmataceae bacterium]